MANPTGRQLLIIETLVRAAQRLPIVYEHSTALNNALTSVGIGYYQIDAQRSAINPKDGLEALARAIDAARFDGKPQLLDAIGRGERWRVASHYQDKVNAAAAAEAEAQSKLDAISQTVI